MIGVSLVVNILGGYISAQEQCDCFGLIGTHYEIFGTLGRGIQAPLTFQANADFGSPLISM